jgi:hypothetical protein
MSLNRYIIDCAAVPAVKSAVEKKFIQRFNGAKGLQSIPLQVLVVLANIKYWHR